MLENELQEELIQSWLFVSKVIKNEKLVDEMPYNEAYILYLIKKEDFYPIKNIIQYTKMLKSQVNRTVKSLEEKELLEFRSSLTDKRCKEVRITEKGKNAISIIHNDTLEIATKVIDCIGEEKSKTLISIFNEIIEKVKDL